MQKAKSTSHDPSKFQGWECSRCTICCNEPIAPVTDADVHRIQKATNEKALEIVSFYSPDSLEYNIEAPLWINFSFGKRAMGLKKRFGHCRFLVQGDCCSVYKHRPMTCRTFPYVIDFDDTGIPISVKRNKVMECLVKKTDWAPWDTIFKNSKKECIEDDLYYDKIDIWNSRSKRNSIKDFLIFLGLEP